MNNISKENVHWLAGLLEGEGSFFVRKLKNHSYPTVMVKMCDKDIIDRLQKITGIGKIYCKQPKNLNWKTAWAWQVSKTHDALDVMRSVRSIMGNRRKEKIDWFLSYEWPK